MWKDVRDREGGAIRPVTFRGRVCRRRVAALDVSNQKEIVSAHRGGVNSLQVDLTEGRYLLAGASDGSAAVYDINAQTDYEGGGRIAKHRSLLVVDKQHAHGHKIFHFISCMVVMDFKMPGKVYGTSMSSVATTHMLIAAGTEDVQVRLCDIASGAFTHTLSGHRDGIMTVEWSSSSDWILMTGGCDGAVRFWDIRRAGCFLVLDQSRSQFGSRSPLAESSSKKRKVPHYSNTRKLSTSQRGKLIKGFDTQRLHPGMSSSRNRSTAHYGAVTGLRATKDGMYLLSTGSDSRLRLWDIESGCNTLVNFEATHLHTRPLGLAVGEDSSLVFVPCMATVKAFDMWSGATSRTFRGHFESVNCCFFSAHNQELYSGSNDRQILVWSPPNKAAVELDQEVNGGQRGPDSDQDRWSD
ncbi:unnamed protein product [Spirodela intermedia]|uniref:Uncharacterized protein n=1 Tax=Spirodela intermedia TaxID=51605 RepID=A0A7I8IRX0_SPIIN|nr:unnamed protein product [Spirodela intermedia]CAA6660702.1 unnamed protein product [Spirodela intermedia]